MFTDHTTNSALLLDAQVTLFDGAYRTPAVEQLTLAAMLARMQDGTYQAPIEALRTLLAQDAEKYKKQKTFLPAFTPACAMHSRAKKTAWKDKLIAPTQLVHLDVDHVDAQALKARIIMDPSVVFAFISPSGAGVKLGIASAGITDTTSYKQIWRATIEAWKARFPDATFKEDEHVKYLNALCFVSHDPELYVNANAVPFLPPPSSSLDSSPSSSSSSAKEGRREGGGSQRRRREEGGGAIDYARVEEALRHVPAEEYDTWLTIGMALHSTSEPWARAMWDTWSQRSAKYDPATQESTWSSFTADGGTNIGTLFYLSQQYGYRPPIMAATNGAPAQPTPASGDGGTLPYSDYTNALAFVRDHGANLHYCHLWRKWLHWTGTHWDMEATGQVMRWAKETIKRLARQVEHLSDSEATALLRHIKASLSTAKLKAMVENAESELPLPVLPEALDCDPWLLNVANGTLDLRTATLRPHDRADMLTRCLPVAYDPQATCPTWERFLWRIMGGTDRSKDSADDSALTLENREAADDRARRLIDFLQRAVGYALTGVIREHVLLILWGSGRNGKSTFLGALLALLGSYALKAPAELLLVSQGERHPTERADLFQKRFAAVIETEQGRRLAEVFVKEATGGDAITARRMREDFWTFQPTHKLFLATNHKPVVRGTDEAIWARMRLVPFTVTIPPKDRDTTLPEKLQAELPGILAWAVRGCRDWQNEGLGEPEEVTKATEMYRKDMDVLGQFIEDCCLTGDTRYQVKASELYEAYKRWCDQSGEPITKRQDWGTALTERGCERYTNNGTWYRNITLQPTSKEDSAQKNQKTEDGAKPRRI